jgi:hypothetical protein
MALLRRLGVAFRFGFFALAAGAVVAACGSISVISPDDGPGTGGATAGGTGGHGSSMGGRNGGVGGRGGAGLSDGGALGGTTGGGAGGSLLGSGGILGGLGGSIGSGGRTAGAGGTTSGGGGTSGGLGGSSGLGGYTGGMGGTPGLGGRGGSQTCADIRSNFDAALAEAKTCNTTGQCQYLTNNQVECGCPTSVSHTDKVDSYRQAWSQYNCASGVCPAIACPYVGSGICTLTTSGNSTCVDQSLGAP